MSQYLTHFYCGNKRGLCNYNKPVAYEKLLDRNFDPTLIKMLEDCKGAEFQKGYCCDPHNKEMQKPMDDEYMEHINQKFEDEIFKKDEHDNFYMHQVPLIKKHNYENKLDAIEVCTCGGTEQEYANCVAKNCADFKKPTRYDFCKMGDELNKFRCVVRDEAAPTPSPAGSEELSMQDRCKLEPLNADTQYTYSHKFKINNLYPDCYLNMCNKDSTGRFLDNLMASSTTDENKYFKVKGDSLEVYNYLETKEKLQDTYESSKDPKTSLFGLFQN